MAEVIVAISLMTELFAMMTESLAIAAVVVVAADAVVKVASSGGCDHMCRPNWPKPLKIGSSKRLSSDVRSLS